MRINYTFRQLESSDGMKNYANEKIARLQKFLDVPIDAEVVFSMSRHLHCVDISLVAGPRRYAGTEECEDMYASIDRACDRLDRQIRSSKGAETDRKRHSHDELLSGKNR